MSNLVAVEFETSLGAVYKFPDMEAKGLNALLADLPAGEKLTLVNVSFACLTIPLRIVDVVRVNGEERWRRT